jgi:hypothetical protein
MMTTRLLLALVLPAVQASSADTAVLRLGRRAIMVFRSPGTAPTLDARVSAVSRRVKAALETGRDSVSSIPTQQGVLVLIGGDPVFIVTPADVDTAAGESSAAVVQRAMAQLRLAVRDAREAHDAEALLREAGFFVVATGLFLLALGLLLRARAAV